MESGAELFYWTVMLRRELREHFTYQSPIYVSTSYDHEVWGETKSIG